MRLDRASLIHTLVVVTFFVVWTLDGRFGAPPLPSWFTWPIACWYFVHWGFLALSCLKAMRDTDRLTPYWAEMGVPLLILFAPLDVVFMNWIYGTLLFRELPRLGEWTFSARVERHFRTTGPRAYYDIRASERWAWILNQPDPGHIR